MSNLLEVINSIKRENNYISDSKISIDFYPQIGIENANTKHKIINFIEQFIEKDKSHLVTGGYLIENIETRPTNAYLVIYEKSIPKIILNVNQNRIIVIADKNANESCLKLFLKIINSENKIFVFTSGENLISFIEKYFNYTDKSYNIVFTLENFNPIELSLPVDYQYLEFDLKEGKTKNLEYMNLLKESYDYEMDGKKLIEFVSRNPHVIIVNKNREICSSARCNSFTPKLSVVGGVATRKVHRKKGLGRYVSYKITENLQKYSKTVVLETEADNFPAIKIYKSIGFEEVGKSMFVDKNTSVIKEIRGERDY